MLTGEPLQLGQPRHAPVLVDDLTEHPGRLPTGEHGQVGGHRGLLPGEPDRTDQLAHVGAGVRVYLARRFVFRAQYKNYVIFQSTDDNQEIDEWKAGFSVFF